LLGKKRSVGDLLGVVLVLSSRARRMAQPPVSIDIDVFAPGGKRALRLNIGRR
jgi:anthranilate phosphoribosyltransferase